MSGRSDPKLGIWLAGLLLKLGSPVGQADDEWMKSNRPTLDNWRALELILMDRPSQLRGLQPDPPPSDGLGSLRYHVISDLKISGMILTEIEFQAMPPTSK